MALERCNEHNIANTLAIYLASQLLDDGYLVYWHAIDAVQTPTGWLAAYSTQQDSYLADLTYQAQLQAAKGLLTILPEKSAIERWITRPTNSGAVERQESVPIPALAITVGPLVSDANYQMGDRKTKWRSRTLIVEAYARDHNEQSHLADALQLWLDSDARFAINDHENAVEGQPLAVINDVEVNGASVDTFTDRDEAESTTFEVLYSARLTFVS